MPRRSRHRQRSRHGRHGEPVTTRRTAGDWALLLLLVVMWGTSFMVTRIALDVVPPATVVTLRLAIGAAVLTAIARLLALPLPRQPRLWLHFTVLAIIGFALPFLLITWGQQRIDSGLAGVLMAVMPVATLLLAHFLVEDERMTPRRAAGFAFGFVGIVVLTGPAALQRFGGGRSEIVSQVAVLAGALCYAVNTVIARFLPDDVDSLVTAAAVTAVATLTMVPVAWVLDGPTLAAAGGQGGLMAASPGALLAVAWLGLVSTAAATLVYFRLIAHAGPTFLSLINYLIPLVAVAAGVLFLGEHPRWSALVALAIILVGLALGEGRGRPEPTDAAQ